MNIIVVIYVVISLGLGVASVLTYVGKKKVENALVDKFCDIRIGMDLNDCWNNMKNSSDPLAEQKES